MPFYTIVVKNEYQPPQLQRDTSSLSRRHGAIMTKHFFDRREKPLVQAALCNPVAAPTTGPPRAQGRR